MASLGVASSLAADVANPAANPTPSLIGSSTDDGKDVKETKEVKETIKESCITGDLGVTFVSEYVSRGLVQVNQGVIAQPYLDLYFKVYEGTGFINKVTINFSLWSSIDSHVEPPGNQSTCRNWEEFDWDPGIAITFAKNFTLTTSYYEFDSPANFFLTARSINVNLAYNDADLLHDFALNPHFTWLAELNAPGSAGINKGAYYYELGIAPGHTWGPVTVSLPITLGLGSHGFYNGNAFGYFCFGPQISVPISFIPECLGKWTFSGGYTFYELGTQAADVTANGHRVQHVFQGAIGLTF
jgi:hypothetical protein